MSKNKDITLSPVVTAFGLPCRRYPMKKITVNTELRPLVGCLHPDNTSIMFLSDCDLRNFFKNITESRKKKCNGSIYVYLDIN